MMEPGAEFNVQRMQQMDKSLHHEVDDDDEDEESGGKTATPMNRQPNNLLLTNRVPKIKVQHRSNEFTILRAVMNEINS